MNAKRNRAGIPSDLDRRRRKALKKYQLGLSVRDCARLAGCSYETARKWIREAERIGFELALQPRTGPKIWPPELKQKIVSEYLLGASPKDLMIKYALPHSNYPGMWVQAMPPESLPDHASLAHGAYRKAIDASVRRDERWKEWATKMRTHFDHAIAEADTETEQLRLMRMQVDLMEKSSVFSSSERFLPQILVQVVTELKAIHPVGELLRAVGLARSTYYWHVSTQPMPDPDAALKERVLAAHAATYAAYGYRRLQTLLQEGNDGQPAIIINHKKLRRIMNALGIQGKTPTKKRYNSFRGEDPDAVNSLNRQFHADAPGQVLVTDITMFTIGAHNLYFSPLIDIYNNQVVSWRLSSTPNAAMVSDMLVEGLEKFPAGSVQTIQTDQGAQYSSSIWKETIMDYAAVHSMSRVGNCHDNAPAESFFARVKTEFGRGEGIWSPAHFERQLAAYLQWWNEERITSRLGTSPLKYLELEAA